MEHYKKIWNELGKGNKRIVKKVIVRQLTVMNIKIRLGLE